MDRGEGFYVRVAEPSDSPAVESAFRSSSIHCHDFSKLIEDSLYSFLGLSSDDEVLAFAAFNDAPNVPGGVFGKKASDFKAWALDMSLSHGFRHDNSLWVDSYLMPPSESHSKEKYLKAFLSAFFKISPQTRAVLALSTFEQGTGEILKPVCSSEEMQLFLSACSQSTVNPKFSIRLAVEENYDDLCPIVENAQKKGALLSKIPDSAIPAHPYSLARLIAAQDKNNRVLVAEVDNKPVGMIAVTAALDPKILAHFQLDTYSGLISAEYEEKDYCIIEVPYNVAAPYSLQYFSCVPKKEGVTEHNASVHILHRHSLTQEFKVHLAKPEDTQIIKDFVGSLEDCSSILDHLEHLRSGCCIFVATSQKQPVGLAFVDCDCPTEALFSHFDLRRFVNVNRQNEGSQAVMTLFELSPLFWSHRRVFLREIMRQMGKTVIFMPVFSPHNLTDLIRDMLFVPGRWHPSLSPSCLWQFTTPPSRRLISQCEKTQGPTYIGSFSKFGQYNGFNCAVFIMTHRLITRYRALVNSRIVFVGASRTAATCLDKLISCANFKFTNLTLVSPFGTKGLSSNEKMLIDVEQGPPNSSHKLGIDYLVNVISATVVEFDRKEKSIHLSNGKHIRYDYLVITTGLQDQTRSKLKLDRNRGIVHMDELSLMIEEKRVDVNATETGVPIVIYGLSLETFAALQILMSKGVPGHCLVLLYPEIEPLASVAERCFGDKDVSSIVVAGLIQAGVTIKSGLRVVGVNSGEATGVLQSIYLENTQKHDPEEDLQDQDKFICQPCMLLVVCATKHVDEDILQAIRKAGIVFNGRIVVDGNFQTNDRFILACGSAVKFSRKCGKGLNMESYNSCELGMRLADAIISLFRKYLPDQRDLSGGQLPFPFETIRQVRSSHRDSLPRLILAKGVGALLPQNLVYFHLKCPTLDHDVSEGTALRPFILKKHECVFRIDLGKFGQVSKIVYCGKDKLEAWKLIRIVGVYDPLIKNMVCSPAKDVFNIEEFFSQPWFRLVFHDKFYDLYDDLCINSLKILRNSPRDENLAKHLLSDGLFEFLNAYRSDFPELGIKSPGRNDQKSVNLSGRVTAQQMLGSTSNLDVHSRLIRSKQDVEHTGEIDLDLKEVLHKVYNEIGPKIVMGNTNEENGLDRFCEAPHVKVLLKNQDSDDVNVVFTVEGSNEKSRVKVLLKSGDTDYVNVVCLVEGCNEKSHVRISLKMGDHGHVNVMLQVEDGNEMEIDATSTSPIKLRFHYLEEEDVIVRLLPRRGDGAAWDSKRVKLEFGYVNHVGITLSSYHK